jgi:nucleoside-diphosphate-sugar epimerase
MKILITGAKGFIGSHLSMLLVSKGHEILTPELDLLKFDPMLEFFGAHPDLDLVIHLAGISHVPTCQKDPSLAIQTNVGGTALLLEAMKQSKNKAHFVFFSTGQVYAPPPEGVDHFSFKESSQVYPQTLYAQTKWQAELLIQDNASRVGLPATIIRLFNHTHHTQAPDFFLPSMYQQMKANTDGKIAVGNLDLWRDVGSVQELLSNLAAFVDAFKTRGTQTKGVQVFNLSSGTPKHLRTLAEELARQLNLNVTLNVDPTRVRFGEPKIVIGDSSAFRKVTGTTPSTLNEKALVEAFLSAIP